MRIPRVVEAMQYLDDDLISEAIAFRRVPLHTRLFRKTYIKACACFLVAALVIGIFFFLDSDDGGSTSPFILTAYAISNKDTQAAANILAKGKKVPISTFETENGLSGFVISCNKVNDTSPPSVIIIADENHSQDHIAEIAGIEKDPTQNYYFYIPGDNAAEPYTLPLFLTDREANLICQYTVTITQMDGNYYAELTEENMMERVTTPTPSQSWNMIQKGGMPVGC